ncbi:hypothetical protein PCASD_22537 [Puccinia coronata f. sp. avenae]|uniref:Uncharacterized protein n=1 Tax=Puccinia coronata f. sp. avenae TaxID=200324 RepID=A0A2N5THR6_9BASI|nr:hypothetical protein PCASD_22537 [Puccinia coronata f. sp. avenae]
MNRKDIVRMGSPLRHVTHLGPAFSPSLYASIHASLFHSSLGLSAPRSNKVPGPLVSPTNQSVLIGLPTPRRTAWGSTRSVPTTIFSPSSGHTSPSSNYGNRQQSAHHSRKTSLASSAGPSAVAHRRNSLIFTPGTSSSSSTFPNHHYNLASLASPITIPSLSGPVEGGSIASSSHDSNGRPGSHFSSMFSCVSSPASPSNIPKGLAQN